MTYQEQILIDLFRRIKDDKNKQTVIDVAGCFVHDEPNPAPAVIVNIETARKRKEGKST